MIGDRKRRGVIYRIVLPSIVVLVFACSRLFASAGHDGVGGVNIVNVLLALIVILAAAKLGGEAFVRLGQPAVLGELVFGIVVGNLALLGFHGFDVIVHVENSRKVVNPSIEVLSKIGVIVLLFQVGLESDLKKMVKVGPSSLAVATLGVIAPFFLGWGTAALFLPDASVYVHIFVGATLCATSVGITARVFLDLGRIQTPEARIVLGAAVIDDVQGLVILGAVTGLIKAAETGGTLSTWTVMLIVLKAVAFLVGAIVFGQRITPRVFHVASRLRTSGLLLTTSLGICFVFAYLAGKIGLDPIVGAFAAGIILEEVHWRTFTERGEHSVEELVEPIAAFLVPIFFVTMGAKVDLTTFGNLSVLGFAGVLTAAAIAGKQICGLGVLRKGVDRLTVGIGMIPRGEVGLIFVDIGSSLMLGGAPVIGMNVFSAVVIMVVVTTMIAPPALKISIARGARLAAARPVEVDEDEAE
ncbi:MAG: hypothetical protein A2Z18_07145 [Armatimonadetes bacterium RBG_16_58_9]|nr:MAG: hypothetical protein A2Z18_07145 [Armatimonadetes bacterium RBG_16_58_9]